MGISLLTLAMNPEYTCLEVRGGEEVRVWLALCFASWVPAAEMASVVSKAFSPLDKQLDYISQRPLQAAVAKVTEAERKCQS